MTRAQLSRPKRVWINAPSTLQPDHKHHGRVGIAVTVGEEVIIYFTEGEILGFPINPLYLSELL